MWKTVRLALLTGSAALAITASAFAQSNLPGVAPASPAPSGPPGTTGNPAANRPAIPGAVSPSNPDAASRPQVPNISGSPVVVPNTTGCGSGSAGGRPGC
jgi:hypothetical protein